MKKVIFTIALFCITTGLVFAQITLGGDAYAGVQFEKIFDEDEQITATHRTEGTPVFNIDATVRREIFGIKLDTSFRATETPVSVKGLYGWVDFWDRAIRFSAGIISDPVWVVKLDPRFQEFFFDDVTGFRLEYRTPVQGLSVGIAFRTEDLTAEEFGKRMIFGGSYIHSLFNTVAAYDLGRNGRALFGFNYTGINNLTAGIQLRGSNFATWDDRMYSGELIIHQKIAYRILRPLEVSLITGQTIYGREDRDIELSFAPGLSYRIQPNLVSSLTAELSRVNNTNRRYFPDDDMFIFTSVRPSLEYNLGPAIFYAEYELMLGKYKNQSYNRFGVGVEFNAF